MIILDEPTAALGVKEATHVLRIIMQAKLKGIAVILVTHNVSHALTVGDHFAVLIRGQKADDFAKGERTRDQITDQLGKANYMHTHRWLADVTRNLIHPTNFIL